MASSSDNISMAVFCDFENVALGVRDANYEKFDIKPVLERLLLKGSIVVKKAYCDWERYKGFKATMHEANFELIEIPHVRQSGKNSADIRLVVDALDLCYTKSHVNTFVIISGDSDFSPLVSKLRENAKQVIGVGVKQSTSDLLVANCDEFIFYDDLVREVNRTAAKREERKGGRQQSEKRAPASDETNRRKEELETRKALALEMVVETFDALVSERGDSGKIWASLLKDTLKRRRPDFNESYFGFSTFGKLLEEAQSRGLLEFGRDEKSGAYVYRSSQNAAPAAAADLGADSQASHAVVADDGADEQAPQQQQQQQEERPRSRSSFRAPVEAQPADEPQEEAQPKQGRGRGRNRERNGADVKPAADQQKQGRGRNRERAPSEAQPVSHDNALPAELRGRNGRSRNGRGPALARSPEAEAERAFHEQQQALERAAARNAPADSVAEPSTVEEAVGQLDVAAPVAPAAKERRRAPRKSAAQKAAEAASAESASAAEAAVQAAEAAPAASDSADADAKPARKSAARKTPARPRRTAKASEA